MEWVRARGNTLEASAIFMAFGPGGLMVEGVRPNPEEDVVAHIVIKFVPEGEPEDVVDWPVIYIDLARVPELIAALNTERDRLIREA